MKKIQIDQDELATICWLLHKLAHEERIGYYKMLATYISEKFGEEMKLNEQNFGALVDGYLEKVRSIK